MERLKAPNGYRDLAVMEATVHLPEVLAHRLNCLAEQEGTSLDVLVRRLVSEHLERREALSVCRSVHRKDVHFPLIQREQTGVISPLTGADIDEMFSCDHLAS